MSIIPPSAPPQRGHGVSERQRAKYLFAHQQRTHATAAMVKLEDLLL